MKFTSKESETAVRMHREILPVAKKANPVLETLEFSELKNTTRLYWKLAARWHLRELKKLRKEAA